jgi:hypothetical protein
MKIIPFKLSLLLIVFTSGCSPSTDLIKVQNKVTVVQAKDTAKAPSLQAQNLSFDQKTEFIAATKKELDSLNRDLDKLSEKIQKAGVKVRSEARPRISEERGQAAQLSKLLDKAADATTDTWSAIRADSEKTFIALKEGVAKSRQWIDDTSSR